MHVLDSLRGEVRVAWVAFKLIFQTELFAEPNNTLGLGDLEVVDCQHVDGLLREIVEDLAMSAWDLR